VAVEPRLPDMLGDPTLFEQALGNVIENALRYAGGGAISVAARRAGDALVIEVSDHGPGVPAEDLERIFEKFHRSASAAKTAGTGLGLSITRGLIGAMGGQVVAEPRADGAEGLVVRICMPTAGT
jgi:two-component system sensor histidine kinase KdpD